MAEANYGMRLTKCVCGHEGIAHYDSWSACTYALTDPPECDCEEFRAAGPEVYVTFSALSGSASDREAET